MSLAGFSVDCEAEGLAGIRGKKKFSISGEYFGALWYTKGYKAEQLQGQIQVLGIYSGARILENRRENPRWWCFQLALHMAWKVIGKDK